jgi:hypothetical protein
MEQRHRGHATTGSVRTLSLIGMAGAVRDNGTAGAPTPCDTLRSVLKMGRVGGGEARTQRVKSPGSTLSRRERVGFVARNPASR